MTATTSMHAGALGLAATLFVGAARGAEPPAAADPAAPSAPPAAGEAPAAQPAPNTPPPAANANPGASAQGNTAAPADYALAPNPEESAPPPPDRAPIRSAALPPDRAAASADFGVDELDDGRLGTHQSHVYASLGVRSAVVSDGGYDPYATNDVFTQVSIALGGVVHSDGPWSLALGAAWDFGMPEADARGAETSLAVHRLTLAPEVRYHVLRRFYGYGRLGGGIAFLGASLQDRVAAADRTSDVVAATLDPGVGLAFELAGARSGATRQGRFWLFLDAGYLWTASADLTFSGGGALPERAAPIDLGGVSLSGPYARLSAALTL